MYTSWKLICGQHVNEDRVFSVMRKLDFLEQVPGLETALEKTSFCLELVLLHYAQHLLLVGSFLQHLKIYFIYI